MSNNNYQNIINQNNWMNMNNETNNLNMNNINNNLNMQYNPQFNVHNNIPNNNMNLMTANFKRKCHIPEEGKSIVCSIENESNAIDRNETNVIKNIIQMKYSSFSENPGFLSDFISEELKKKLKGEWFVFVSDARQNIPFIISTLSEKDYLIIKFGNSKFHIAKIK